MDASTKLESGLLQGNLMTLGSYDECLAVEQRGQFQGRFCLVGTKDLLPNLRPVVGGNSQVRYQLLSTLHVKCTFTLITVSTIEQCSS